MDASGHGLPAYASFGEHRYPVAVIMVWRIRGGWHLSTLLYRGHDGPVTVHPLTTESFSGAPTTEPEAEWGYLAERLYEGRGGNGYTFEVEGFEVAEAAHIEPIVMARAAEIVAATYGPMGEVAGTMIAGQSASDPTTVMPFVLLVDDAGDRFLVETEHHAASSSCEVRTEAGKRIDAVTFDSLVNWQRSGARSWPVVPQTGYLASWSGQIVWFVLDDEGGWGELRLVSAEADGDADEELDGKPTFTTEQWTEEAVPGPLKFRITRVPAPRGDAAGPFTEMPDLTNATGEQYEWGYAIPWMFRALASPLTNEPMPARPRPGDDVHAATSYWASLLHLLCYSFGWARPDHGLHWWFEAGKPVDDDPRLQLLNEVWDADGQLTWFAAQLSSAESTFPLAVHADVTGYRDTRAAAPFDRGWVESQRTAADSSGIPSPISGGGSDPLHLSYHCSAPLEEPVGEALLFRCDRDRRHAMLQLDSMVGWYRALCVHGAGLPELHGHSWHVDVVVRPVGWLGTYRLSRSSGLWFSGRHRYHARGV